MLREYKIGPGRSGVRTIVELPVPLREALDDFSEETDVPLARIVRRALYAYLEAKGVEVNDERR